MVAPPFFLKSRPPCEQKTQQTVERRTPYPQHHRLACAAALAQLRTFGRHQLPLRFLALEYPLIACQTKFCHRFLLALLHWAAFCQRSDENSGVSKAHSAIMLHVTVRFLSFPATIPDSSQVQRPILVVDNHPRLGIRRLFQVAHRRVVHRHLRSAAEA